ncbi:hypothetical protein MPER_09778 [Moniliophthora perniciosa FA553]|nr:hypothetical protein MPER_09778 [Moniliophthora perniciosa FA553]
MSLTSVTFGCAAYVHIPEERRKNKLAPKAEKMTFIGYESGTKGYIFMRSDNTIFIGVKGFFLESTFPRKKSSEQPATVPEPIPDFDEPSIDHYPKSPSFPPVVPDSSDDDDSDHGYPPDHDVRNEDEEPPLLIGEKMLKNGEELIQGLEFVENRIGTNQKLVLGGVKPDRSHMPGFVRNPRAPSPEEVPAPPPAENTPNGRNQPVEPPMDVRPATPPIQDYDVDSENEYMENPPMDDPDAMIEDLARGGGEPLLSFLMQQTDTEPELEKVREWNFRDIKKLPKQEFDQWMDKCKEEISDLKKRDVYEEVHLPKGKKAIKCRWYDMKP